MRAVAQADGTGVAGRADDRLGGLKSAGVAGGNREVDQVAHRRAGGRGGPSAVSAQAARPAWLGQESARLSS
jgi:hypothetical protein